MEVKRCIFIIQFHDSYRHIKPLLEFLAVSTMFKNWKFYALFKNVCLPATLPKSSACLFSSGCTSVETWYQFAQILSVSKCVWREREKEREREIKKNLKLNISWTFISKIQLDWQRSQRSNQQQFQKHIDRLGDIFEKCENQFTEAEGDLGLLQHPRWSSLW